MINHFDQINNAVRPLIFMMREEPVLEEPPSRRRRLEEPAEPDEVPEETWDDLKDAPVMADPLDDFACKPCNGDDDEVQDDEGNSFQVPRGIPEPKPPSVEAQRRHNLTHWPYASWCPHCIMGRRNNTPHFQSRGGAERSLPLLVLDYCFIRNAADQDLVTLLVGKLYPFRRTFACVIDLKGKDAYAVARLSDFIRGSGLTKFVYKSDQEVSVRAAAEEAVKDAQMKDDQIKDLMEEAIKKSGRAGTHLPFNTAVPELSAVGESASNGRAERAVQTVEDQLRVGKSALEARLGAKIPCSHPVIRWMVEHYVDVINKYSINKTGMSPYEELHGKRAVERRVEFGERIFYSTPKKGRAKMDLRWKLGIYLGSAWSSNEIFIGTKNGNVSKARSAVRVVEPSRWNLLAVQNLVGIPGDRCPVPNDDLNADDVEATENPHDYDPADIPDTEAAAPEVDRPHSDHRRMKITQEFLNRYGKTPGCVKCASIELGERCTAAHNEECRRRIYQRFKDDAGQDWARVQREQEARASTEQP